ncbi:MAG TPA: class I SAM-dependent methyltransferase [Polyangia bacterium]|jgi:SAM-dependent methyltransferase|nr:class I SAM-dependent methyltransferase [Polyangia bacterium]
MNRGVGDGQYFRTWYGSRDWRFYRMFLADIVQHAEPGPILDVGAGLGYFVEAAQRWGLACAGLEGSADAVAMGRERYPTLNVREHRLSEPFPFADASFGVVLFNQVIEHLEAEVGAHALREIHRVLRPSGMLLLFSPSRFNEKERVEDPTHINLYAPSELQDLVRRTGFERIVAQDDPLPLLGPTPLGRRVMHKVFKHVGWERLSASANVRAFKPGNPTP